METGQKSAKNKGKNFIRVSLHSGTRGNPLGNEEIAIFCQCDNDEPAIESVDTKGLIKWVNGNQQCQKNQSNNRYMLSQEIDAMTVIFLSDREIHCCNLADRIYPRLLQN